MEEQKKPHRPGKRMTLRSKINWLVFLNIMIVLTLVMAYFLYMFITTQFRDTGQRALVVAETVANIPEIIHAFEEPNPSDTIQPLTKKLQVETGAQFIVVANMNQVRYSHPNPSLVGKVMDPDPGDDQKVLTGLKTITKAMGSLGLSVRGKAPIFNSQHHQIGIVSVGYLVNDIWSQILQFLLQTIGLGVVALALGFFGAYLLSGHIRRQILNMEPFEIAFLAQKQLAILESIREGIIAVDREGKIITCNPEAKRLLGFESTNVIGEYIQSIIPNSRLPEVLENGVPHRDQPMIVNNTLIIVNRVPVTIDGSVVGAVASFRDKIELEQIDQRLADVGRYADALRSQRHEFMNKLHTISGLIKLGEYDLVRQLIHQINDEQQQLLEFFMNRIRDAAVVGILTGKMHHAKEFGITLTVDSRSYVSEVCPHRETVVTILGNTIENAIEAIGNWHASVRNPFIDIYLKENPDCFFLRVADSGPGIQPDIIDRIFEDGITTKGPGRGFGLALVHRLVSNLNGQISVSSTNDGTIFEILLPKTSK
jgi:two-component system, CitB family, sensor kinase